MRMRRNFRSLRVRETLTMKNRIELEEHQRKYQALCIDFAKEVIELLGGIDGDAKLLRKAQFELATTVADAIARFVVEHSG